MKLYDYFRSSAAYRVRIALNLKGFRRMRSDPTAFEEWLSVWELWSNLFLGADKPAPAPLQCAEAIAI